MENFNSSEGQIQAQVTGKPAAVTVFGVLNIVFGVLGLLISSLIIFGMMTADETRRLVSSYKIFLLVMNVVAFGFSVWLSVLGIGLLGLAKWARRGSIIYACLGILLSVIETGVNVLVLSLNWITVPKEGLPGFIGGMCGGFVGGLIYPVLLLIFMQTAKVKQAFEARERSG